jgi:hypothetical protein
VRILTNSICIRVTVPFTHFTVFFPGPFLSLPQWAIQLFVSLNRSQTAYLVDGVGCLLQIFWISHIELLRIAFDGELALKAL